MAKNAPWYFRLASARIREGKRGGWALLRLFHKLGLLDRVCGFTLPNGEPILMPLSWPGVHDPDVFVNYEPDAIDFFAAMIETDSCSSAGRTRSTSGLPLAIL